MTRASAWFALVAVALLLPLGSVSSSGPFGPDEGRCTTTAESKLGEIRAAAYTEDPTAGTWRPWQVGKNMFVVTPPPSAASPQAARERAEILAWAATRTDAQVERAAAWGAGPASRAWDDVFLALVIEQTAVDPTLNPPRVSRALAVFETAMFDALVAAWDAKYCFKRAGPDAVTPGAVARRDVPSYPSEHAVAAGVASRLLPELFPLASRAEITRLVTEATESRVIAGVNWRSDVDAGIALGAAVAQRALELRRDDGSGSVWDGSGRITGPCHWEPTPPDYVQSPVEPLWKHVRPWVMARGDQFRPPPPPTCGEGEYLAQTQEIHAHSLILTPAERTSAFDWDAGRGSETPPGMELHHALNLSASADLSTMRHVRLTANLAASLADAAIAAWDAKYTYWSDRPVDWIRANADPAWLPTLRTPDFPGYVSGHATFAGASERVLAHHFPTEAAALRARAQSNADSRFLGGVHIEADNEIGLTVGHAIGALVVTRDGAIG